MTSFRDEWNDGLRWYRTLPEWIHQAVKVIILMVVLMVASAWGTLTSTVLLLGFWTLASWDNATLGLRALFLAFLVGCFILLPLAGFLSTLILVLWHRSTISTVIVNATIEQLLVVAALLGLLLWSKSRLRLSSSIMDFALTGLWMGAGMEFGIGFLGQHGLVFHGAHYGLWPQLPGLISAGHHAQAAMGPAAMAMMMGALIGLMRYLLGPVITAQPKHIVFLLVALLLFLWFGFERAVMVVEQPGSIMRVLTLIDLKGRLLLYLTYIFIAILIVVEWLLISGLPGMANFSTTIKKYQQAWRQGKPITIAAGMNNLIRLSIKRRIARERALAGECQSMLTEDDRKRLEQRLTQLQQVQKESNW